MLGLAASCAESGVARVAYSWTRGGRGARAARWPARAPRGGDPPAAACPRPSGERKLGRQDGAKSEDLQIYHVLYGIRLSCVCYKYNYKNFEIEERVQ